MKLIDILSEIGDASAKPFPWTPDGNVEATIKKEISKEGGSTWEEPFKFTYTINSPKTIYQVFILGTSKDPNPYVNGDKHSLYISVAFDIKDAKKEDQTTNLFEQYSLIATVIECVIDFIKKVNKIDNVKIVQIYILPKSDDPEGGTDFKSKRGKLYVKYIEKNLNRLPGNWKINITNYLDFIQISPVKEQ
jgi:hypothetical protein